MSILDFDGARRYAPTEGHREFADAIADLTDSRMIEARQTLRRLTHAAADSQLRQAAYITLASVLQYDGAWSDVHDLATEAPASFASSTSGRAGITAWAGAMRMATKPSITFGNWLVELPLERSPFGTPVVAVMIGGKVKHFWIDTGSTITLVASDLATECGLTPLVPDSLEIVTTVGRVPATPTVIPRLSIGAITIEHQTAAIVSQAALTLSRMRERHTEQLVTIDGVLGLDVLRHLDVRIDFGDDVVAFRRPTRHPVTMGHPRNLFWLGFPVVRLGGPNGRPMYFGLDTGADSTYGTSALMAKLPRLGYRRRELRITGMGGDTTAAYPTIAELRFAADSQHLRFHDLVIRDDRRLIFLDLDGVLGADVARGGYMRIDLTDGVFALRATP
jgi:predicted aspartyl protease